MESLSRLIIKATAVGVLEGIHINGACSNGTWASHLLFADDTLIFCKPEVNQLGYLRCILVLFATMSGLKVNMSKSVLIPVGEVPELI